jgi:hypothetical protein
MCLLTHVIRLVSWQHYNGTLPFSDRFARISLKAMWFALSLAKNLTWLSRVLEWRLKYYCAFLAAGDCMYVNDNKLNYIEATAKKSRKT